MPCAGELPESTAKLVNRHALELSPSRFDFDTGPLLRALDRTLAGAQAQPAATDQDVPVAGMRNVYALDAACGHVRWVFATADAASSPVVAGGAVYVGSADRRVYALDAATGHVRWAYTTGDYVQSCPAVAGGTVYVGNDGGNLYALDAATGHLRWTYTTARAVTSNPVVAGGTVYVGSDDRKVYAVDAATGHVRWAYPTGSFVDPKPKANTSDCYRSQVRADPARRA